jgi:hypothetical protein
MFFSFSSLLFLFLYYYFQHPHNKQFNYVRQTLILWREILNDFFRLWYLAEADLLDEDNRYELVDTGQGYFFFSSFFFFFFLFFSSSFY